MDLTRKRNLFLAITVVLVVAIVAVSAVILVRGPRESSVELVSNNGDGTATVTGVRGGTVKIAAVATDGSEVNGQMELTVFVPVTSFHIIPSTANVYVGRTLALKVDGTPGNATLHAPTDFTWESSDESNHVD